jgi:peptide/nickel transport system substrate-binding protein
MKKILLAFIVLLIIGTTSVFAKGPQEPKPAPGAGETGEFLGEDTIRYTLEEWKEISGKRMRFNEAPELEERVKSKELPKVEERIGEEPMVVQPVEAVGTYGGTWRRATLGVIGISLYFNETLVTFDYKHEKIVPSVAKAWDVSPDGKSYTFYLRKGMKWSDGEPFTADDLVFRWNDMIMNEEFSPGGGGSTYAPGGEPGKITKIDDYTVKYTFAVPHVLWLEWQGDKTMQLWAPKHYLEKYHPKYASKADLDKLLKDEDYATWMDLLKAKLDEPIAPTNLDAPTIEPWIMIDEVGGAVQRHVRNPYYWKVDIEGNQLPYIDEVHEYNMGDAEAILLKTLAGEIDVQGLRISSLANYPTTKENEEKGDYKIVPMQNPATNYGAISINMFHSDPVIRELFWNKDFRIALSIAIDRKSMNQLIFKGLGVPSQPAPPKSFAYYNEKLSTQYTEYDPDKANKILDELGLKWDKNHKNRLRPDGKPLRFVNLAFTPWPPENVDMQEMVKNYWAAIGIEMSIKPTERALWVEKVNGCVTMMWPPMPSTGDSPAIRRLFTAPLCQSAPEHVTGGRSGACGSAPTVKRVKSLPPKSSG